MFASISACIYGVFPAHLKKQHNLPQGLRDSMRFSSVSLWKALSYFAT